MLFEHLLSSLLDWRALDSDAMDTISVFFNRQPEFIEGLRVIVELVSNILRDRETLKAVFIPKLLTK